MCTLVLKTIFLRFAPGAYQEAAYLLEGWEGMPGGSAVFTRHVWRGQCKEREGQVPRGHPTVQIEAQQF